MGLKSTFSNLLWGKKDSDTAPEIKDDKRSLFEYLPRAEYLMIYLDEVQRAHILKEWIGEELVAETDRNTVFICGGYASYIAGLTDSFGDIDYFCTSRDTFYDIWIRLDRKEKISENVIKGEYKGSPINVIYNPGAVSVEDILDGFDMTWCRVAIDLVDRCIVMHPLADQASPVFDANCFKPEFMGVSLEEAIERACSRYLKYKNRRVKLCPLEDCSVNQEIAEQCRTHWGAPVVSQQNSQTIARTSY